MQQKLKLLIWAKTLVQLTVFVPFLVLILMPLKSHGANVANVPAQQIVRVGYVDNDHMMAGMSDETERSGLAYEYLQKVSYYTGWKYEYVDVARDEIGDKMASGEIDLMPCLACTKENEAYALFPDYIMVSKTKADGNDLYLAVNKKRSDLLTKLNDALATIESIDPSFTRDLADRYIANIAISLKLSEEEQLWVDKHSLLRVGYYDDYLPFSATDKKGKATGIMVDILKSIVDSLKLDHSMRVKYIPYADMDGLLEAVQSGEVDLIFPVGEGMAFAEKNNLFLTSDVITTAMTLVFNGEYKDSDTERIAVKKGNRIQETYTRTLYPDAEIVWYDDMDACFDAVNSDEVGSTIINEYRRDGYLKHVRYQKLRSVLLPVSSTRRMAVAAGNTPLLSILNRGISALPDNFEVTATYHYIGSLTAYTLMDYLQKYIWWILGVATLLGALVVAGIATYIANKKQKRVADHLAHYDAMTNLPNRRSFDEDFDKIGDQRMARDFVFMSFDLNELKTANDTMGHEAGDEMIIGTARCLTKVLSSYGRVYRIGGDEFAAMLSVDPQQHWQLEQDLQKVLRQWKGDLVEKLSLSIGFVSAWKEPGLTLAEMRQESDRRMYEAKEVYYEQVGHNRRTTTGSMNGDAGESRTQTIRQENDREEKNGQQE